MGIYVKAGIIKSLVRLTVLILAISLINGCKKESEKLTQLREENKALKERVVQLESQLKTGETPEPQIESQLKTKETPKSQIDREAVILARKLNASPGDFVGKKIKLQGKFRGLSANWLDRNQPDLVYFPSSNYLGFFLRVPDGDLFQFLFVKKTKGDLLYELKKSDPITVYGRVKSAYNNWPWIEVEKVERGWK